MMRSEIVKRNSDPIKPESRYGKMKNLLTYGSCLILVALLLPALVPARAAVMVQCPGDNNGDADWDDAGDVPQADNVKCMHLSASDGFANMGDGYLQYVFGFGTLTGTPPEDAVDRGLLHVEISAPTITLEQDDEFYLSLTNTGMINRPDLFDPHTVHYHGFPNASSVFDGVPDASISINGGATLSYYYNVAEEGTYMYHCHVEAAEHMQMGMLGNLYVHSRLDRCDSDASVDCPSEPGFHYPGAKYVYSNLDPVDVGGIAYTTNDTQYDVEYPIQIASFDPDFHDASMNTQPLPFANMKDRYHLFNGRGYPATVQASNYYATNPGEAQLANATQYNPDGFNSQPVSSLIEVPQGQKLLLRISTLNVPVFHPFSVLGLPMKVVGQGGRELTDKYETSSVNLGGGEAFDVIIDTTGVEPGTYFAYITELQWLSNNQQSFGGPMTEIRVAAPL